MGIEKLSLYHVIEDINQDFPYNVYMKEKYPARWIGKGFAPGIRLKLLNPDGSFRKIITTDQKHVDKLKAALVDFVILEPIQNKAPHGLFGVQK